MKEYILEACVDSVESAMAAVEGGADRLELCGNLIIGGTTPGPWLFDEIRKRSDIRIHALIRPRFGVVPPMIRLPQSSSLSAPPSTAAIADSTESTQASKIYSFTYLPPSFFI